MGLRLEYLEQRVDFPGGEFSTLCFRLSGECIGEATLIRCHKIENLGIERFADALLRVQVENAPIFPRLLPKDADIDLVGVDGVLEIAHVDPVAEGVGELLAVVLLEERGMDEILVALIDVLRAATGAGVDRVDDDVEDGLAEQPGPLRFGHQHGQIEESAKVEDAELWGPLEIANFNACKRLPSMTSCPFRAISSP